jgi:hypothetical protein
LSDAEGYRRDVIEAVRGLGVSILRWPGGNFASGYNWTDGIGAKADRPVRAELAWNALESNRFGTDEFLRYCERIGAAPYICINLGLGTVDDARHWVEYTNEPRHTYWADLRRKNGGPRCLARRDLALVETGHLSRADVGGVLLQPITEPRLGHHGEAVEKPRNRLALAALQQAAGGAVPHGVVAVHDFPAIGRFQGGIEMSKRAGGVVVVHRERRKHQREEHAHAHASRSDRRRHVLSNRFAAQVACGIRSTNGAFASRS